MVSRCSVTINKRGIVGGVHARWRTRERTNLLLDWSMNGKGKKKGREILGGARASLATFIAKAAFSIPSQFLSLAFPLPNSSPGREKKKKKKKNASVPAANRGEKGRSTGLLSL